MVSQYNYINYINHRCEPDKQSGCARATESVVLHLCRRRRRRRPSSHVSSTNYFIIFSMCTLELAEVEQNHWLDNHIQMAFPFSAHGHSAQCSLICMLYGIVRWFDCNLNSHRLSACELSIVRIRSSECARIAHRNYQHGRDILTAGCRLLAARKHFKHAEDVDMCSLRLAGM